MTVRGAAVGLLAILALAAGRASADEAAAWRALAEGGHLALVRHATAPGIGDPPGFSLEDCATQRNLDAGGREEARRIGAALRQRGIAFARVLSSAWCRCRETARLLGVGEVEIHAPLNNLHGRPERREPQLAQLRPLLTRTFSGPSILLVSHQSLIAAATGEYPRSGEIVVVRPEGDRLAVVGRIPPPRD